VIFVIDSSILFDLQRGGVLDLVLPTARFEVPQIQFDQELQDESLKRLLHVTPLDDREEKLAAKIMQRHGRQANSSKRQQRKQLSQVDCAVIALATRAVRTALVGDAYLKEIAKTHGVECKGLLGLFCLLDDDKLLLRANLVSALLLLRSHPRTRLPLDELDALVAKWR
jgi:hypothetical protein